MDAKKGHSENPSSSTSTSRFPSTLTKLAVAQICQSVGFKRSQPSALDALTTIATFYLQHLSNSASSRATSCGRTQCNLFDLVSALEDLASPRGFPGAANIHRTLMQSSTLDELSKFVSYTAELPFAKPLPRKERVGVAIERAYFGAGNTRGPEIPKWLPPFPDIKVHNEEAKDCNVRFWEEGVVLDDTGVEKVENGEMAGQGKKGKMLKGCAATGKARNEILSVRRRRVEFKIGLNEGNVVANLKLSKGVCGRKKGVQLDDMICQMLQEDVNGTPLANGGIPSNGRKYQDG